MQTAPLGATGLVITRLGLGAQTIGGLGYGEQHWNQSGPALDAYIEGGGRFIDTARGYGASEAYVGQALAKHRLAQPRVVVCSKSGITHPPCIEGDLETTRALLGRDSLDVYYLHVPPHEPAALDQVLSAYERFRREGRIRHIGLSCWPLDTPESCEEVRGWIRAGRAQVIQFPYSFTRPWVGELIAEAAAAGIGCVVRQALEGGLLSGAYRPGHRFTDTANDGRAGVPDERMQEVLRLVERIRTELTDATYRTVGDLALAYALSHPGVAAVIPGGADPEQIRTNLAADRLPSLPEVTRRRLEEIAQPIRGLLQRDKKDRKSA